jgi:hypothetical protein
MKLAQPCGKLCSEFFRVTVFEVVGRSMRWEYLCFDCLTEIGHYF